MTTFLVFMRDQPQWLFHPILGLQISNLWKPLPSAAPWSARTCQGAMSKWVTLLFIAILRTHRAWLISSQPCFMTQSHFHAFKRRRGNSLKIWQRSTMVTDYRRYSRRMHVRAAGGPRPTTRHDNA